MHSPCMLEKATLCVILGCGSPVVLRPTRDGLFYLVGDCPVPGLLNGDELLGRLPSPWVMGEVGNTAKDFLVHAKTKFHRTTLFC
jgi:hypothetical protein